MNLFVVYEIGAGKAKRIIPEGIVKDIPDDVKLSDVTTALESSAFAGRFMDHGIFLANRRIVPVDRITKSTAIPADIQTIAWADIAANDSRKSAQLNVRVTTRQRAAYTAAAQRASTSLGAWAAGVLDEAARPR